MIFIRLGIKPTGWMLVLGMMALGLGVAFSSAEAQDEPEGRVQVLEGYAQTREGAVYHLPDLQIGQTLYIYVSAISGNLDPFVGMSEKPIPQGTLLEELQEQIDLFLADGRDPVQAQAEIFNTLFIAWDDDGGDGYDAALVFPIPADGDYRLIVVGNPAGETFGDYRLVVGLDAPEVLKGETDARGKPFVFLERSSAAEKVAVNEVTGSVSEGSSELVLPLRPIRPGETLYVYVEATSGNLTPIISLEDFGGKILRSANKAGTESQASLSYSFEGLANNYRIRIEGQPGGKIATSGDFRLLVGVNNPDVLSGKAPLTDRSVLREPIEVKIGVKLQQITEVDQVGERFGAVAELRFEWEDPELAFSPDECECDFKVFTGDEFTHYANEQGVFWPDFTIFNQQGNRFTQNRDVEVRPDGRASYFERFTTNFQAPDFQFSQLPFDTQQLYIRIQSLFPEEYFVYDDLPELSAIGDQLGEEEWYVVDDGTEVTSTETKSMFSLRFDIKRKVNFYIFRIIVPIALIVIVSWITFFLSDYTKRVEVASANLLVFVTFNFIISSELPKLGYLTFMDTILIGVFIMSALVVVFNVSLKRMEITGRRELAEKIDRIVILAYPLVYGFGGLIVVGFFLV